MVRRALFYRWQLKHLDYSVTNFSSNKQATYVTGPPARFLPALVWTCRTEKMWTTKEQRTLENSRLKPHHFMGSNWHPEMTRDCGNDRPVHTKTGFATWVWQRSQDAPLSVCQEGQHWVVEGWAMSGSLWTHLLPKLSSSIFTIAKLLAPGSRGACQVNGNSCSLMAGPA